MWGIRAAAGAAVVVGAALFLSAARGPILLILISLVLSIGFQPGRQWLEAKGFSRRQTLGAILLLETGIAAVLAFVIAPRVVTEFAGLIEDMPGLLRGQGRDSFLAGIEERWDLADKIESFENRFPDLAATLADDIVIVLFSLVTVVILTTYFTVAMPRMQRAVARILWQEDKERFETILEDSTERVGAYVRANLLISVIAGVTSFVVLLIIGVPSPAALAFFVAVTDLLPLIGAFLGAGAAIAVAAFEGTPEMVATGIFFLVYQQVENYLIQPRLMGNAVKMSPATVIIAVMIGGAVLGFTGALVALPIAAILKTIADTLYLEERVEAVSQEDTGDRSSGPSQRIGEGALSGLTRSPKE